MIITFHSEQFFKVQAGDTVLAFNPISIKKGDKVSRFGADVVFSTQNDDIYNGFDTVTYGDKEPVRVYGPGSYEIDGLMIQAFGVEDGEGKDTKIHTLYSFVFDDMKVAYLGSVGKKESIPPEAMEAITESDIIFISVTHPDAYALAVTLAPKIIIPMGYNNMKDPALSEFLQESGGEKVEKLDKLTIKRKDIETLVAKVCLFIC